MSRRRGRVNTLVDVVLWIFLGLAAVVPISFLFNPRGDGGGGSDRGGFDGSDVLNT